MPPAPALRTLLLMAALAVAPPPTAAGAQRPPGSTSAPGPEQRITAAARVRLRAAPSTTAPVVGTLPLAAVLNVEERAAMPRRAGGDSIVWYRGSRGGARVSGWVDGTLTLPYDARQPLDGYRRVAAAQLAREGGTFEDAVALELALAQAYREAVVDSVSFPLSAAARGQLAEVELYRLQALQRALDRLAWEKPHLGWPSDWSGEQPLREAWLFSHDAEINYSESGGQWLVDARRFWALHDKYRGLPVAERLAWAAAKAPLGGECEGDPRCVLGVLERGEAAYLRDYPTGPHAEAAMEAAVNHLSFVVGQGGDAAFCEQLHHDGTATRDLQALRAVLARVPSPRRPVALSHVDRISRLCP